MDADIAKEMLEAGLIDQAEFEKLTGATLSADDAGSEEGEVLTKPVAETVAQADATPELSADEIAALHADDEGDDTDEAPVEGQQTEEDLNAAVEAQEAREAAYAEQEDTNPIAAPAATPTARAARAPRVAGAATARTPKRARINNGGSLGAHIANLIQAREVTLLKGAQPVEVEGLIDRVIPAVKVREKAAGLFEHIYAGKKLSTFTQVGAELLRAEGTLTPGMMVKKLVDEGEYTEGTARSQAQQIHQLFKTMGFIGADNKANADSVLFEKVAV